MKLYAILDNNNICIGLSQLNGELIQENMVELIHFDSEYMWKKYENGMWSIDKYKPNLTAPIDEFQTLKTFDELFIEMIYLAQRIIDGSLIYTEIVIINPNLKTGIDTYLKAQGREDLIAN